MDEATPPARAAMTIDEVLLWLNDRLGKTIHVTVDLERDDQRVAVLEADGVLQHWRERGMGEALLDPHDDLAGLYFLGDAHFDFSELGDLEAARSVHGGIDIVLVGGVTLYIFERDEPPE